MKKLILAALATAAFVPMSANAAVTVFSLVPTTLVDTSVFDASAVGANHFDNNAGLSGTYTLAIGTTPGVTAAPFFGPAGNQYLSVGGSQAATLQAGGSFNTISLYWGSIDNYNNIDFYDGATLVGSFNGGTIAPADGGQANPASNQWVTLRSDAAFTNVVFKSSQNAFELDNVKFSNAVPEPATWAMMITGFGFVGGAMRRRRSSETLATA